MDPGVTAAPASGSYGPGLHPVSQLETAGRSRADGLGPRTGSSGSDRLAIGDRSQLQPDSEATLVSPPDPLVRAYSESVTAASQLTPVLRPHGSHMKQDIEAPVSTIRNNYRNPDPGPSSSPTASRHGDVDGLTQRIPTAHAAAAGPGVSDEIQFGV